MQRLLDFDFLEKVLGTFFHHIFFIFQERCFSRYILLTDQISLSDCLHLVKY